MYYCLECGHLFEDGEQSTWQEDRGEYWGTSSFEKMSGCPICKGAYEEAKKCKICGGYHSPNDDYEDCYCKECILDVEKRFKTFILNEFSDEEKELLGEMCGDWI